MKYSGFRVVAEALFGHKGWKPLWRDPDPKPAYDFVIVGGGGHGLATAYYLAKTFAEKRIAVLQIYTCELGHKKSADCFSRSE